MRISDWSSDVCSSDLETVVHLRTWTVIEGDFAEAPDIRATWFVDPPYVDKGRFYRKRLTTDDYDRLGAFSSSRRGQVVACEGPAATLLPFRTPGSFKSTPGQDGKGAWRGRWCKYG